MSNTLKRGVYVGADGRERGFIVDNCPINTEFGRSYSRLPQADLRTAAAALIALADELETEVVELETPWFGNRFQLVIPPNGEAYLRYSDGRTYRSSFDDDSRFALAAYRAGLAKGWRGR